MATLDTTAVSTREAEVLAALGEHLTNAEIGQRLHISVRTVESHVSSLLRKLGAADRRDLAGLAASASRPSSEADGSGPQVRGLPVAWTSFVGRTGELRALTGALAGTRLVTLVGPGGVGKTRLATEAVVSAVGDFPGGCVFVDLVPATAEFVVAAVAAALGVTERPRTPLEQVVLERLGGARTLLVLDNCEHVLHAASAFARSVLSHCPGAVLLATSRERLDLPGERVVAVRPLPVAGDPGRESSEATQLFHDRAGAIDAAPQQVAEICRRLDGMPLAIELAAARSLSLGVDTMLAGLDDHLRLISRTSNDADRHASLRAVIDWSYQLLDEAERAAFMQLGIFAGTFDLAAAAAIVTGGDVAAAGDLLGRLTDKSLLVHVPRPQGSRWRMLETVHKFAHHHLAASGEAAGARARHQRWAAAAATALVESFDTAADESWQERFDLIAGDLRAALQAPPPVPADGTDFRLALALARLTYARQFQLESRDHFQTAVMRAPDTRSAVEAMRLAASAAFAEMRGESSFDFLRAASVRAAEIGDHRTASIVLADAATLAARCPALFVNALDRAQLEALMDEATLLAPAGDDLEVEAHLALASVWSRLLVAPVQPVTHAETARAVTLAEQLGDPVLLSSALDAAASFASTEGHQKEASRRSTERLSMLDRLPPHDPRTGGEIADTFHMATESAVGAGELETATKTARRIAREVTNQGLPHFAASHLMPPLVLLGEFDEALGLTDEVREGWELSGRPVAGWMSPAFFAAAFAYRVRGDADSYRKWWELGTSIQVGKGAAGCNILFGRRGALHDGDLDEALRTAELPAGCATQYDAYAIGIAVELAVVTGAPDAEKRLVDAQRLVAEENDFVSAQLLRAAGRLHGDPSLFEQSVAGWEAVGARYERACTLLFLPARLDEGLRELAALGCTAPAPL